ncbi:MAG: large repetitive protein, partial [Solirubrobacteraceae bacterium]|nr:large repetitive protein [Solirubrobacteraceae bacterium]
MNRAVRVAVLGLQLLLALAFAAGASAWRDVSIYDWGFYPGQVSVEHDNLQFTNETSLPQQVISDEGLFDSGAIPPGGGFSLRIDLLGTHPYHSADGALKGSIAVPRRTLGGQADDLAADHIPDIAFPPAADGDRAEDPELGILASRTRILVTFVPGATVADANEILGWAGVMIIGGIPDLGVLLVEAPDYGGDGEGGSSSDFSGRDGALETLRSDDRVEAAAKDMDLEPKAVPRPAAPFTRLTAGSNAAGTGTIDVSNPASWAWGDLGPANELYAGDNWYLEADRAPQAWNLLQAIKSKNATVMTGVIDDAADKADTDLTGVQNHQFCQTVYLVSSRCTDTTPGNHGTHVAGTIGGAWDDNTADGPVTRQPNATGIDGINPVAKVHNVGDDFQGSKPGYADELTIFDNVLDEVRPGGALAQLRAINYSIALPPPGVTEMQNRHATADCGPGAADDGQPGSTQDCSMENDDIWLTEVANVGPIARRIAERASGLGVIIVQAAGNESNDFCAPLSGDPDTCPTFAVISGQNSGEFIWASKRWTSPKTNPIIGVEAIGDSPNSLPGLMRAKFSNDGGDISAPGVGIISTGKGGTFRNMDGTSMAAPQVTGAITYLLSYRPDMTIAEVKSTLLDWARPDTTGNATQTPARTPQPRLDLFASLLSLPGAAKDLVDVNDRTKDGNQRVERHATPPNPTLAPEPIKPDGKIDMRDFRAFRDAWLQGCGYTPADTSCPSPGEIVLDGGPTHGKNDANLDGCVAAQPPVAACLTPENVFSRFDFNGDGRLDRLPGRFPLDQSGSLASPPGTFMTDLNVLMSAFEAT